MKLKSAIPSTGYDEETGEVHEYKVTYLHIHDDEAIVTLVLSLDGEYGEADDILIGDHTQTMNEKHISVASL